MSMRNDDTSLWEEVRNLCLVPSMPEYEVTSVSDALVRVIAQIGDVKLPDRVATAVEHGIFTFEEGSLLIGVASYSTDDEGSRIQRVLEHWLETNTDENRVGLALDHDTVPFRSRERRVEILTAIASRFPKFAEKCHRLMNAYKSA